MQECQVNVSVLYNGDIKVVMLVISWCSDLSLIHSQVTNV